ncbi:SCP2 sterol-binding domain-containing protein [Streptomyces sp. MB09-01]|uniref:SCP2 sterol-binding domain-containing protein n=1 Tax=Streptomyces sp. MB09-01 TaxID=3028666 RepID=UPI0029B934CF|nr:SCP2 sterol-binding domain-containing protein [Streptomyces sp. MB09-01]MDX3538025.1 SCP2 sterol-binding domain-containing protein [Streptomyces sp. MB09-01]
MSQDVPERESTSISARFQGHDFLLACCVPWTPLVADREKDLDRSFRRLSQVVGTSPHLARIHFKIMVGDETRSWTLEVGPEGSEISAGFVHGPDLELIVGEETWWQLARGELSPLEAFGRGKMRVIGDLRVARHLVAERLKDHKVSGERRDTHGAYDRERRGIGRD